MRHLQCKCRQGEDEHSPPAVECLFVCSANRYDASSCCRLQALLVQLPLSPSATMVSYRRGSEMLPAEASSAQYIQVSPLSGMSGVKAILTPVLLPVACTAGALGLPADTVLLAADSAPGPLSFTVRALQRGCVQGCEVRSPTAQQQQFELLCMAQRRLGCCCDALQHPLPARTHTKETRKGLGTESSFTSTCSGSAVVPTPPSMHTAADTHEAATFSQPPAAVLGSTMSMRSCS